MNVSSSSLQRPRSSSDLQGFNGVSSTFKETFTGSPWLMLLPKDGGCVLYNPKEGKKIHRELRDFPGSRILANSGYWLLLLDSGSYLVIIDVFSDKTIPLPSLESIASDTSKITRVGDRVFEKEIDDGHVYRELSSDVVRGLLWVDESGTDYVVVWFFDLPGHSYISFCKKGDTHYTDIPLFFRDAHFLDGLSYMVLGRYSLYISTSRRFVKVLDLSGPQGFFKDITEGNKPFSMLSRYQSWDSSIAVTTSGEVLLVESNPWQRDCFRVYKYDPNVELPDYACHTVLEVDSLGGEALLLDLGFTMPANDTLGIEPDSIYFTRHYRPCQLSPRDLDICVFNLVTKTLKRFPALDDMNLMDARWFLPGN
ncbi:hypothetical protein ISN44_As01g057190 [Arabidopsis suecica]|uniref:KIB1-4 beta-propeller domain-containing protein n=1 Tax=Arabidopsis suecica TaxID=45249 RepID=A0A8T2HES2_ARASU|nr:hypothetical protein ISN44_As01g057190 [Arabidopsis suecica]